MSHFINRISLSFETLSSLTTSSLIQRCPENCPRQPSRWCTFGWFKSLADELLDYAYNIYRNKYVTEVPSGSLRRLDKLQNDCKSLMARCERACRAGDANDPLYFELVVDPFKPSSNVWPRKTGWKTRTNCTPKPEVGT